MLVNETITNAEVWHNVTESEIEEFENLDKLFFRRVLIVPKSTPIESFYLELGEIPIGIMIKARIINYLHSILSRDKNGMLYSFFTTQWNSPSKGDWTELVQKDLEDFNIPCSFNFILSKSKEASKNLVKRKTKEYAIKVLRKKQDTHSKMKNMNYEEIKIQKYLIREDISYEQKKIVFKFRTQMAIFGENYRGGRVEVICPLCETHLDKQELSYECPTIKKEVAITGSFSDIYSEEIELNTVETIKKITEVRKEMLQD